MPVNADLKPFTLEEALYHASRGKVDLDAAQKFFDENQLGIDLKTNRGLERVIRVGNSRAPLHADAQIDYFFGEEDMTDLSSNAQKKSEYLGVMCQTLMGDTRMQLLVYKGDEKYPRRLSYDKNTKSFQLSEPMNPETNKNQKKPNWFHRLLHGLFPNLFSEEFAAYDREQQKYEELKQIAEEPEKHRGERIREREAAQDQWWKDINLSPEEAKRFIAAFGKTAEEMCRLLDEVQASLEEMKRNQVDCLDYVMIDGKTLRGHLTEMSIQNQGKAGFTKEFSYDEVREQVGAMILQAQLAGKAVEYYRFDPKSMELLPNAATNEPEHFIEKSDALKELQGQQNARAALQKLCEQKTGGKLAPGAKNAEETYARREDCRVAVQHLHFLNRSKRFSTDSLELSEQLLGGWAKKQGKTVSDAKIQLKTGKDTKLTIDRSSMEAHSVALLLSQGMTVEQIADPGQCKEEKAAAGERIADLFLRDQYSELAEINAKGAGILLEYLNKNIQNTDFTNPESVFSKQNQYTFSGFQVLFDLFQEAGHMKPEMTACFAKELGLDRSNPEQLRQAEALRDAHMERCIRASTLKVLFNGYLNAAKLTTGDVTFADQKAGKVVEMEVCQSKLISNKNIWECLTVEEGHHLSYAADNLTQQKFADQVKTFSQAVDFGRFAQRGGLKKQYKITYSSNGERVDISMQPRTERAKAAKSQDALRKEKTVPQRAGLMK